MGLDMYLNANKYLSGFADEDTPLQKAIAELIGTPSMVKQIRSVTIEAAYWRKENAIHKWFVDTVQDGEDNCASYYVSRNQLIELRDLCAQVLADHNLAEKLLPTQSGFFFGVTEYDDGYFQGLQDTVIQLTTALALKGFDYEYTSSW